MKMLLMSSFFELITTENIMLVIQKNYRLCTTIKNNYISLFIWIKKIDK